MVDLKERYKNNLMIAHEIVAEEARNISDEEALNKAAITNNSLELANELTRTGALYKIAEAIQSLSDKILELGMKKG